MQREMNVINFLFQSQCEISSTRTSAKSIVFQLIELASDYLIIKIYKKIKNSLTRIPLQNWAITPTRRCQQKYFILSSDRLKINTFQKVLI